jgi:hypothetical protein
MHPTTEFFGYFLLALVNVATMMVMLSAVVLYRKAYFEMKKTPMILSVLLLLFSIFIDSLYDLISVVMQIYHQSSPSFLANPYMIVIPKFLIMIATIYFVFESLSPQKKTN